jgi:hypothetical protein
MRAPFDTTSQRPPIWIPINVGLQFGSNLATYLAMKVSSIRHLRIDRRQIGIVDEFPEEAVGRISCRIPTRKVSSAIKE